MSPVVRVYVCVVEVEDVGLPGGDLMVCHARGKL